MLGKIINGYKIIATSYEGGNPDNRIVILGWLETSEKYITATINDNSLQEWQNGQYFEEWHAAERAWQDFIHRAG